MPGNYLPVTLHVEPSAIVAIRAAVKEGLAELTPRLVRLGADGYVPEAWLGDPISENLRMHYNTYVMDAPEGPYAALKAYEAELMRIHDSLKAMEDHYSRTEGDNTALWGKA
jgi:hypothetical protein